jgi:hypothetical protein
MTDNTINTADLPDEWNHVLMIEVKFILDRLVETDTRLVLIILQSCVFHVIYNGVKEESRGMMLNAFISTGMATFDDWKAEDSKE